MFNPSVDVILRLRPPDRANPQGLNLHFYRGSDQTKHGEHRKQGEDNSATIYVATMSEIAV